MPKQCACGDEATETWKFDSCANGRRERTIVHVCLACDIALNEHVLWRLYPDKPDHALKLLDAYRKRKGAPPRVEV